MHSFKRLEMMAGPMFMENDGGAGGGGDDAAAQKVAQEKAAADEKTRLEGLTLGQLQKENATLRFENAERRVKSEKADKAAAEAAEAQKLIDEKAAVEKGEFKTLYEKLKGEQEGSAGKVTAMTATLDKMLEVETANIPEAFRALIPTGDVMSALEWIATAKGTKLFESSGGPVVRQTGEYAAGDLEAQHSQAMKDGNLQLAMSIKSKMRNTQKQ